MIALTFILYAVVVGTDAYDYCVPSNKTCWPADSVRDAFEAGLDGMLFYPGKAGYDLAKYVKNWAYITSPALIVSAKSVADVQSSILYGRKYDIKMSFLSSGHDYIGRNTGFNTLMVRMNEMNEMVVFPSDANSPTGASMIAETGANWGSVYKELDKYNKIAVGGAAHGVAMGGWFLGGGHSPLSRKLGLGVDQILSYAVVLPDGRIANVSASGIVYANGSKSSDTDLFWALRGGGGGALAIVTSFHFKLHDPPAGGFVTLLSAYPWYKGNVSVGDKVLDTWNKFLANELTENWGGYVIITHVAFEEPTFKIELKGNIVLALVHWGPWSEAVKSIAPITNLYPQWRYYMEMKNVSTFWGYTSGNKDDLKSTTYIVNRLVQPSDLVGTGTNQTGMSNLATAFKEEFDAHPDLPKERYFVCTGTSLGKKTAEASANETAVGPSFRTALMSLSCGTGGWYDEASEKWLKSIMKEFGEKLYKLDGGVYYNEPDSYLTDWKRQYWGSNYDRLHYIKEKYDPKNFLTCLHCIGYNSAMISVSCKLYLAVTSLVAFTLMYAS